MAVQANIDLTTRSADGRAARAHPGALRTIRARERRRERDRSGRDARARATTVPRCGADDRRTDARARTRAGAAAANRNNS